MATRNPLFLPIVAYAAAAYVLFSMKPASMFDSTGAPRPFGLNADTGQTPLPWWLLSLGVGLVVHHLNHRPYMPLA